MDEFLEWLKANKLSASGKFRGKRWGTITKLDDGWSLRLNVQYDEYLAPFMANETAEMQKLINTTTGYNGCGRCIEGKCAFTAFDMINPTGEQIELAKRLIEYRVNAIKEGRIPKCSYIKASMRGENIEPCAIHKVCDPKCKAMKRY